MPARLPAQAGLIRFMDWYVYLLKSEKKRWYYVGSTNRLEERLKEHNSGKVESTKTYKPLKLVFQLRFDSEKDARGYERKIKKMRREKEKIIRDIEK